MAIEGELRLRLDWNGRVVHRVHVASTRPFGAARVLTGMLPADASATVARLFSICSCAQETASVHALAAAAGNRGPATDRAEASVRLEAIQEYLWRILIDWPQAMGKDACVPPVADARRRIAEAQGALRAAGDADASPRVLATLVPALQAIAATHVFGMAPRDFLALADVGALEGWIDRTDTLPAVLLGELQASLPLLGRSDVPLMPGLADGTFDAHVLPAFRSHPEFVRAPDWAGVPVETGALARMQSHPLLASLRARQGNAVPVRMAARLVELAMLLAGLADDVGAGAVPRWIDTFTPAQGEGIAAVQTARGVLLHRARVDSGRVAGYDIVAPTEWNFHPRGALARGLDGVQAGDEATLEECARLVVQGLDPCVACRIEIGHA